jgi:hypothetical protein
MSTNCTCIHEDKGDKDQDKTLLYFLDGSVNNVYPFMVLPKRPMGCQFINAHNKPISEVFNFNTHLQIGDASQVFYSTLYTSKSTQDKDSKKKNRIGCAVTFQCKMKQIPANCSDATTGHNLQGISKDAIIVSSWLTRGLAGTFKNWEYVVLSCVQTLSGLYLVKPIDMDKSFQPSPQLTSYIDKIRKF